MVQGEPPRSKIFGLTLHQGLDLRQKKLGIFQTPTQEWELPGPFSREGRRI